MRFSLALAHEIFAFKVYAVYRSRRCLPLGGLPNSLRFSYTKMLGFEVSARSSGQNQIAPQWIGTPMASNKNPT